MRAVLVVLFCFAFRPPADVTVTDVKGLVSAAGALSPGKTILIVPGTYVLPRRLALSTGGTAAAPVVIASAGAPGSVIIDANGAEEAFLVNGAKSFFTVAFPEYWLFALGAIFILVTLLMPRGVLGALQRK